MNNTTFNGELFRTILFQRVSSVSNCSFMGGANNVSVSGKGIKDSNGSLVNNCVFMGGSGTFITVGGMNPAASKSSVLDNVTIKSKNCNMTTSPGSQIINSSFNITTGR